MGEAPKDCNSVGSITFENIHRRVVDVEKCKVCLIRKQPISCSYSKMRQI